MGMDLGGAEGTRTPDPLVANSGHDGRPGVSEHGSGRSKARKPCRSQWRCCTSLLYFGVTASPTPGSRATRVDGTSTWPDTGHRRRRVLPTVLGSWHVRDPMERPRDDIAPGGMADVAGSTTPASRPRPFRRTQGNFRCGVGAVGTTSDRCVDGRGSGPTFTRVLRPGSSGSCLGAARLGERGRGGAQR